MSFCTIRGICGHEDDFDKFVSGQPKDHFKCPKCGRAFKIVQDKPTVYPSGFVMPGKRTIVPL